ncbi:hypothetical protein Agub_g12091 [Astrephomene gubernaculifera]|uniref:Uncharacterized protein n=1 Tax=Astrephomene gubernaculifera TaxID=47775 RepID=A0AAD3HR40_9CHLO|nr:hypothetical protein Agub_g12091 [Astrephomene gubernaculifera]
MRTRALKAAITFILITTAYADYNETIMQTMYGSVADWVHYSPHPDPSPACRLGAPLRVAYFTRHNATLWDWIAVTSHLRAPWTRVNPGLYQAYGLDTTTANSVWEALGHMLCHMADILIFSDTIPDARPLLQGGCTTPLILQVTNRFDHGIAPRDHDAYTALMSEAAIQPHVWWVLSNPYEELLISKRGIKLPPSRLKLLRPLGMNLLHNGSSQPADTDRSRFALVEPLRSNRLENTVILPWLRSNSLTDNLQLYRQPHAGPAALAQHRAVIAVPYQMSALKMYEGLSAGAVFVVPSPAFLRNLTSQLDASQMAFCCRDLLHDYPDSWQDYFDWYHKDFINAHILFDSWEHLKRLIKDREGTGKLVEEKRVVGKEAMRLSRQRTLDGYSSLYRSLSQQACGMARMERKKGGARVASHEQELLAVISNWMRD